MVVLLTESVIDVIGFVRGFVKGFTSTSDVTSLAALSNSRFAWPNALAISGSFDGPQRKRIRSIAAIASPSYPKSGNSFHTHGQRSVPYKNDEFLQRPEIGCSAPSP